MRRLIIRLRAYSVGGKKVYKYKLEAVPGTIDLVKEVEKYLIETDLESKTK